MGRVHRWARLAGLVIMLSGMGRTGATAQVHALGPDSFLVAVPIRDTLEIQHDLAEAAQARTEAEQGRADAERLRSSAQARLARKDGEIDGIKAREKTAKDQKRAGEIAALEADRKAAEREKDLIKRRQSLREAEIELEKKRADLADIGRQALELELQLAIRRLDQERRATLGGRPEPAIARCWGIWRSGPWSCSGRKWTSRRRLPTDAKRSSSVAWRSWRLSASS